MKLFSVTLKIHHSCLIIFRRRTYVTHMTGNSISKYVFLSTDTNIINNLAIEEWLYQNYDFSTRQILLLWKNTPAVVVGRHQNPWLEANVKLANSFNAILARRNSGGGAVYHDLENLNLSFFTSREAYNRSYNLEIITRSLKKEWNIDCKINCRDDIVFNDHKVSGTASKLSGNTSYHHCTILVDVNKTAMSSLLHVNNKNIITNATRSKPSMVINLREINSFVSVERLITVIGDEFLKTPSFTKACKNDIIVEPKGFRIVTPHENDFPGINGKIQQFQSWDWIFGRTPKFKKIVNIPTSNLTGIFFSQDPVNVEIDVESAVIKNINITVPPEFLVFVTESMLTNITNRFLNRRFSENMVDDIEKEVSYFFKNKLSDERLSYIS